MKEKKLRKELIKSKLSEITDNLNVIEENLPQTFEDFSDSGLIKDGIYKRIEFSIELILDICAIINSDFNLGTPETEDSILEHLGEKKIISLSILNLIKEMKGFRNILVHKYGKINDEQAFETIKNGLNDFELISTEIEKIMGKAI